MKINDNAIGDVRRERKKSWKNIRCFGMRKKTSEKMFTFADRDASVHAGKYNVWLQHRGEMVVMKEGE